MNTKKDAEGFVKKQFNELSGFYYPAKEKERKSAKKAGTMAHHYGRCEIKELLSFIYQEVANEN